MQKIHHGKQIAYQIEECQTFKFRGEEQDLEEVVGNLLDNACKWANVEIKLTVTIVSRRDLPSGLAAHGDNGWFCVTIEDDGPGMSSEQISKALKRGNRLDESKSGSGLGLSIVEEIVSLYQGKLTLDQSDLGGLKATLLLPAIIK